MKNKKQMKFLCPTCGCLTSNLTKHINRNRCVKSGKMQKRRVE